MIPNAVILLVFQKAIQSLSEMTCDIKNINDTNYLKSMLDSSSLKGNSSKKGEIQKIIGINTPIITPGTLYYVKFNNLSYRECRFITREELLTYSIGKELDIKLRKQPYPFRPVPFIKGLFKPFTYEFNEGFIKPEKIISDQYKSGKHKYLIKWMSLDYDESTWEDKESNVPQSLIHEYLIRKEKFNEAYSKSYFGSIYPPKFQYLEQRRTMSQFTEMTESIRYKNGHTLSQLQIEGVNWLHKNWILHQNSILADQIGLEKSIQILCFLSLLKNNYGVNGIFVILTPFSKIEKWILEIDEWTNFRAVTLTGNSQSRKIIEKHCLYYNETEQSQLIFDVLIVPIDSFKREFDILKNIFFMCLIIDQSFCQNSSNNYDLYEQCRRIKTDFTLLLADPFIYDDIRHLWSILNFIDSKKFPDFDFFNSKFSNYKDDQTTLEKMDQFIKPFVLCRNKENANEFEETVIEVELTNFQRSMIEAILNEKRGYLTQDILKTKTLMKNISSEIRKVCNHPFLFKDAKTVFINQLRKKEKNSEKEQNSIDLILNAIILASGKTIFLDKFLQKIQQEKRKILIFSQMKKIIDILDEFLYMKNYEYERIDEIKNLNSKKFKIEKFKTNPDSFILLFSNPQDSFILNLTDADTVIIFDSDKSSQNDRLFHTKKNLSVFRLITKNTYEDVMFDLSSKNVNININDPVEDQLASNEIELALRKSSFYTFNDKVDEIESFCEEEIDQILETRSHTINIDSIIEKDSTPPKISFKFAQNRRNDKGVNFESPNFWSKILPSEPIDLPQVSENQEANKEEHYKFSSDDEGNDISEKSDTESDDFFSNSSSESDDEKEIQKMKKKKKKNRRKFYNDNEDFDADITMGKIKEIDSDTDDFSEEESFSLFQRKNSSNQDQNQHQIKSSKDVENHQQQETPKFTRDQIVNLMIKAKEDTLYLQSVKIKDAIALLFNFGLYGSRFIKESPLKEFSQYFLLSLIHYTSRDEKKEEYLNYIKKVKPDIFSKIDHVTKIDRLDLCKEEVVYQGVVNLASSFREIDEKIQNSKDDSIFDYEPLMKNEIAPNICCLIFLMREKAPLIDVVIKKIQFYDFSYRVAIFISNEILPKNFYFAPSVPFYTFPFWDVEMDFIFVCSTIIYGIMNIKHVLTDPKLPFSLINQQVFPKLIFLKSKFQLIVNEVNTLIPEDYEVEGKVINDISYFKFLNWKLFNKTTISWNIKKQIIRGLYFYGIPYAEKDKPNGNKNIIKKLKFIFHSEEIEDFTFTLFVSAVLAYAKKYQPDITPGPFNVQTRVVIRLINKLTSEDRIEIIEPDSKSSQSPNKLFISDLRWFEDDKVQNFAKNILIFQRTRNNYSYFNKKVGCDMQKIQSFHSQTDLNIPKWNSYMKGIPSYWDDTCDIKLFNVTACYGFLLFSELGRVLTQISPHNIAVWRLNEINSIRPLMPKIAQSLDFLFPSQNKLDRLEVILNVIQKSIEKDELPEEFRLLDL